MCCVLIANNIDDVDRWSMRARGSRAIAVDENASPLESYRFDGVTHLYSILIVIVLYCAIV